MRILRGMLMLDFFFFFCLGLVGLAWKSFLWDWVRSHMNL